MTEGVQAALWFDGRACRGHEDDSRCPDGHGADAGHHGADPDRVGGLVPCPTDDGCAGLEPRGGGRSLRHVADDVRPLHGAWQHGRVEPQRVDHLGRPGPGGQVEEHRACPVGHVQGVLAGELEADIVLGQQHVPGARPGLGLVLAHPEQLAGREAGQRLVAGDGDEALAPHDLADLVALGSRALVIPEDGRAHDLLVLVEQHETVHLAGRADGRDGLGRRAGLSQDAPDGLAGRRPPQAGVLLGPEGPRGLEVVLG